MAFNFPNTPTEGQLFTDSASGAQYRYTNGVWMQTSAAQIKLAAGEPNIVVNPRFAISQEQGWGTAIVTSNLWPADQWLGIFQASAGNPTYGDFLLTSDDWTLPEPVPLNVIRLSNNGTGTPSPAASNSLRIHQPIERQRTRLLGWYPATVGNRKPAVLRFAAKLTNVATATTFSASIRDDSTSVSWIKQFTVQPADSGKWLQYSAAVPAPTGGTWSGVDSDPGLHLGFTAMAGATGKAPAEGWNAGNFIAGPGQSNLIATGTPQALDITNVGLYADPAGTGAAPPFQANDVGTDLAACMRYYYKPGGAASGSLICAGWSNAVGVSAYASFLFPVPMRAVPSVANLNVITSNVSGGAMPIQSISEEGYRVTCASAASGGFFVTFDPVINARM